MSAHRYTAGAVAWILTLQFFVVEAIAASRYPGYSYADDLISRLGADGAPAAAGMNASFVVQGLLILAGALLLRPVLLGAGGRLVPVLTGAAAVGVVLVGLFPLGGALHAAGAGLHLVGGSTGLIALAYGLRPRSELIGTVLALLGLFAAAMTVFSTAGVTRLLGEGGTERAAAYPLPVGLALAALALVRLTRTRPEPAADRPGRRELREQERAERRRRDAERDAALATAAGDGRPRRADDAGRDAAGPSGAARGTPTGPTPGAPGGSAPRDLSPGDPAHGDPAHEDGFDPEDPWARPRPPR